MKQNQSPVARLTAPQACSTDPTELLLKRLFQGALAASLAASLLLGCPSNEKAPTGDPFMPLACETADLLHLAKKLQLATPADYLELRVWNDGGFEGPEGHAVFDSVGTPCAGASDAAACAAALDEAGRDVERTLPGICGSTARVVVITRGDEVETLRDGSDLAKALGGTIKTSDAAAVLAWMAGYPLDCDTDVRAVAGGFELRLEMEDQACVDKRQLARVTIRVLANGALTEIDRVVLDDDVGCPVCGRRPEGFFAQNRSLGDQVAAYFASCAELEAASVPAFERVAEELARFGAPESLIAQARAAIADEIRHTEQMGRLARHFGATPNEPVVPTSTARTLYEFARENMVEGCVRETFGALLASYQQSHAKDAQVRGEFARIAEDETRHASLAFQIAGWLDEKLDDGERTQLLAARDEAIAGLRAEVQKTTSPALRAQAGFPSCDEALIWIDTLEQSIWSQALAAA